MISSRIGSQYEAQFPILERPRVVIRRSAKGGWYTPDSDIWHSAQSRTPASPSPRDSPPATPVRAPRCPTIDILHDAATRLARMAPATPDRRTQQLNFRRAVVGADAPQASVGTVASSSGETMLHPSRSWVRIVEKAVPPRLSPAASLPAAARSAHDSPKFQVESKTAEALFAGNEWPSIKKIAAVFGECTDRQFLKTSASWRTIADKLRHDTAPFGPETALAEKICAKMFTLEKLPRMQRAKFSLRLAKIASRRGKLDEAVAMARQTVAEYAGLDELLFLADSLPPSAEAEKKELLLRSLALASSHLRKAEVNASLAILTHDATYCQTALTLPFDDAALRENIKALGARLHIKSEKRKSFNLAMEIARGLIDEGKTLKALQILRPAHREMAAANIMGYGEMQGEMHALLLRAGDGGYAGAIAHSAFVDHHSGPHADSGDRSDP